VSINFSTLSHEEKLAYAEYMLRPLQSAEQLKDWIMFFLGLDMPNGHVDPDSNSSPIEAMWTIYDTIRSNTGEENPGYIMLSAREGYKTLSASILEVLLMIHFQMTIAHMAAIKDQSAKSVKYINYFFKKIEDLLEVKGWENKSQNKMMIEWVSPEGEDVYIQIVVATMSGANSAHTNLMFIDEIDVVKDPAAYEEAKLIPGYSKGIHPVTVKLSTRKFAFGLMQQEIDKAQDPEDPSGDKILRWNILDVTERCPTTRHKPELPKEDRYVAKSIPLRQISVEDFGKLSTVDREKWEKVEGAFAGCKTCKLLPVCKTRLAKRPEVDVKGLYKPVGAVLNTFRKTDPDRAEAQLMCWKPSSKGMVYPRFESTIDVGNVMSLEKAWETLIGEKPRKSKLTDIDLLFQMRTLGIRFFAGVDWGYTHDFVIVIFAMIPNGEVWIVDCYSQDGLEFSDCLAAAITYRDKYNVERWFCDPAQPAFLKSFNKNHMKSPDFTKDVMGGIEAIRSKIVDSMGRRYLKVLNVDPCKKIILAFLKHHFKLGPDQKPTLEPDDTPGVADQADAMRYVGQCLFPVKGPQKPLVEQVGPDGKIVDPNTPEARSAAEKASQHQQQMKDEISRRLGGEQPTIGNGRKGGFFYSS
jgi:hypothetical protein